MSFSVVRSKKEDPFWRKVERIFGEIPKLIQLVLDFNGFDTHLALKGIRWDDKALFFEALEESVAALDEVDDNDHYKQQFAEELIINHQKFSNFRLKLGHKNLIINLCHELQKTNLEEFNGKIIVHEPHRAQQEIVVRKSEEHGYSRENENLKRKRSSSNFISVGQLQQSEHSEEMQYVYEAEDDEEEDHQFIEPEFLEELDTYEQQEEDIEYQEMQDETEPEMDNGLYASEQIIKTEAGQFETSTECYELTEYDTSYSESRSGPPKSKKPKHMYTEAFLQNQMAQGRIGTPGRRRPKIQKHYPDTEEGLLDRWADLVRQSCEVIVPTELLSKHDLSHISIVKTAESVWEVQCPMCTKKLRLQLTHEGKYTNYKRSNFERHLRVVHYKQICQFKGENEDDQQNFIESSQ